MQKLFFGNDHIVMAIEYLVSVMGFIEDDVQELWDICRRAIQ